VIAELAVRQHGVVSLDQLRDMGLSASGVRARVATGRLHRVHRGVYAVGHSVLAVEGRWMAAVLACGVEAVLSHRSAAELWDLVRTARGAIDVTVRRSGQRKRQGIDTHRPRYLDPIDTTVRNGIPCTTVHRTLLDLADVVDRRRAERALEQAEVLRLFDLRALDAVLWRAPTRSGTAVLRSILADNRVGQTITRSVMEERFLALCESGGIPRPLVNAWIDLEGGGVEVDFLWPEQRQIVEVDGYESHGTRWAFRRDRRRDRRLKLAGFDVNRFTWQDLDGDPGEVVQTVGALLR
jgi:hypothetical protein